VLVNDPSYEGDSHSILHGKLQCLAQSLGKALLLEVRQVGGGGGPRIAQKHQALSFRLRQAAPAPQLPVMTRTGVDRGLAGPSAKIMGLFLLLSSGFPSSTSADPAAQFS
jgi:hypothetical protein